MGPSAASSHLSTLPSLWAPLRSRGARLWGQWPGQRAAPVVGSLSEQGTSAMLHSDETNEFHPTFDFPFAVLPYVLL